MIRKLSEMRALLDIEGACIIRRRLIGGKECWYIDSGGYREQCTNMVKKFIVGLCVVDTRHAKFRFYEARARSTVFRRVYTRVLDEAS